MKTFCIQLLYFFAVALLFSCNSEITDGYKLIAKMQQNWQGKWCQNLLFEQTADFYSNDSLTKREVWQEAISAPGNLHIRFNGFETRNGMLFRNDSVYYFQNGIVTASQYKIHYLLLLAFDIYFLPVSATTGKLEQLGFDLSKVYEQKVNNRNIIVAGTNRASDSVSSQFWVDKENLWVVRVIYNNNNKISDVELKDYKNIGGYDVATFIRFKVNYRLVMEEKYFNLRFPNQLMPGLFDTGNIAVARW